MEQPDDTRARQFEALLDSDPDFIALAGLDGRVQFVNASGRALVHYDDAVDVGSHGIRDFLTDAAYTASLQEERPTTIATGRWTGRSELRDWAGGPPVPVSVTSFLVRDQQTQEPIALATIRSDLRPALQSAADVDRARASLAESERRHRALLLHMSELLLVISLEGELVYASPSAGRVLGYPEGAFVGKDVIGLVHPDDVSAVERSIAALQAAPDQPSVLDVRLRGGDGGYRRFEAVTNLIEEEVVTGILVVGRDVTQRRDAERSRQAEAEVLELIATEAPVDDVLTAVSLWVEHQLDGTRCTVMLAESTEAGEVFRAAAAPSMPAEYRRALEGQLVQGHPSPCGHAFGTHEKVLVADLLAEEAYAPMHALARACEVRACWSFPVTSPTTGAFYGTFALYRGPVGLPDEEDEAVVRRASRLVGITLDRQVLLGRLAYQASHDDLTGLPNRQTLLARLTASLRSGACSGVGPVVAFLDLDRLKIVNDSLGHEVGDELLVRIADNLLSAIPEGATVARFGGDEFVVLLDDCTDADEAARVTQEVLAAVALPVELAGRVVTPSASAGLVLAGAGQSATDVLRDADIAMYRAKAQGGSGYALYNDDMGRRAFDRLELEEQIRDGLTNDEFRVVYQPVFELRPGGALTGFEALVRWQHPTRGLLLPGDFIELAEETGLVVPLGEQVLERVARDVETWVDRIPGFTGFVAVNLAARQLGVDELVEKVEQVIGRMAPWRLGLELTESTVMADTEAGKLVLDDLAAVGARLAIDDFGTGFSSLSYLARLPVHVLKIDRSFVHDLGSPGGRAVAAAVVNLATGLGLGVVAEGIETEDQRATLHTMGCQFAQGYLLGRPMPEPDAVALMRAAAR